ncbi:SAM-dependent methyltransferase [Algihabitans albus]|uniref:SAM-dependent methyltransferase n=1 Tax=Algihabitans albus TaxID=2164067 RepID=UPI000E5D9E5F|nr:cyclopropane-fatty-acyl-phospholipid synthase family protein [Algihabitans albus]
MLTHRFFDRVMRSGDLEIAYADGRRERYGDGSGDRVRIRLTDRATERKLLLNPKLAFGEAYMDGRMVIEEGSLEALLTVAIDNMVHLETHTVFRWLHSSEQALRRLLSFNPVARSRRNVHHHYDLSRAFYDLFLDADRQYSCGYYATPDRDLDQAQLDKKIHIAAKLKLDRPALKVLDIGCGWGGLALYLAETAEAEVLGITLSTEQLTLARERAKARGLDKRVRFELIDYRHLEGTFDRIVSVGMFEHVGPAHYRAFFDRIAKLLKPDGVALLHSIGSTHAPTATNPWLRKYIFPGGYTPSLSEVLPAVERSGLWTADIEILRLHYAETLRDWHKRFMANWERAAVLYDERFCRMWEFYLVGCELSFRQMGQMVFQLQMARDVAALPITRDYMVDWKRRQPSGQGRQGSTARQADAAE